MIRKWIFGAPDSKQDTVRIAMQAIRSAFGIFRDEQFRQELEFDSKPDTEKDRIFNELTVSSLVLAYLQTETLVRFHEHEFKQYLKEIVADLVPAYLVLLKNFGVAEKYQSDWLKLIDLRLDEYKQEFNEHRSELPDVEEHNPWVLVVAVECFDHITRGQGKPEEPAYRRIVKWLFGLSDENNKIFLKAIKRI